ncbi:unnamed protein product, partial [Sphagnum troendelagicum]
MLEKFTKENPKGTLGKRITILSIDGGGVRGLVPLVILIELERILQRLDGAERRLVEYFDMVAGTSTGGVITGLITTPSQDVPTRPLFTATQVFNFYDRHATTLLPQTSTCDCRTPSSRANDLDRLLNRTFGTFPHLSSTITSVLIPSFDIRIQEPILFSSWQAKRDPIDNAPVELVCQATSASPTYFPPVEFTLTDTKKEPHRGKTFRLIDGSLAINNPSFSDVLVLSLGTGQHPMGHSAREATRWSLIGCPKAPWVDSVLNATADMVDLNLSLVFQSDKAAANYLRIQ